MSLVRGRWVPSLVYSWRRVSGIAGDEEKPSVKLRKAFQTLGLEQEGCTPEAIRTAYITLAKKHHPDSTSPEADTDTFISVKNAYQLCMSYAKNVSMTTEIHKALEEELQAMDKAIGTSSKHRRVAHRSYLQYDGVGTGTISEREKAYNQQRLNQAQDSVFDKKLQNALINDDSKEVELYSAWPQSTKVTNNLERIANEMIRDSIRRGEFSDLPGQGQPLKETLSNPVLTTMEEKINVMMGSSGFAPDWVLLEKEIRTKTKELRLRILEAWNWCGPFPMTHSKSLEWERNLLNFQEELKDINRRIRDRNLKGPLTGQKVHLRLDVLISQTIHDHIPVQRTQKTEGSEPNSSKDTTLYLTGFCLLLLAIWGFNK